MGFKTDLTEEVFGVELLVGTSVATGSSEGIDG